MITTNLFEDISKVKLLDNKKLKLLKDKINIKEALKNKNKVLVLNYILVKYIKDKDGALEGLKRDKVFKLNIDNNNKFTIEILDFLIDNANMCAYINNNIEYFKSKRNLAYLSSEIYTFSKKIEELICKSDASIIYKLLFEIDKNFFEFNNKKEKNEFSDILLFQGISEIYSFLIYKYIDTKQITYTHTNQLNIEDYRSLIFYTKQIKEFQDVEKLIDNFGYICKKKDKDLALKHPDELFHMSRLYGDIDSNIQRQSDSLNVVNQYSHSEKIEYVEYFREIQSLKKKKFITINSKLNFYYDKKLQKKLFTKNNFLDEKILLEEIQKEYRISKEILLNYKICNDITIWDLILIRRVFLLLITLNDNFLYPMFQKDEENKQKAYSLWIHCHTKESFKEILQIFIDEKKAESFIEEFSWDFNSNKKLDLQYTPFIKYNEIYYTPINIFIGSNSIRNVFFKNGTRPNNKIHKDVVSEKIFTALKDKFEFVAKEVKFKNSGFAGDFDVIAYIDNVIYIFECKNILTPVGIDELRATHDNIKKGFNQLDKYKQAFKKRDFIKYITSSDKLNWSLSDDFKIVTCLVLGNRMFNGYTNEKHHIRSVFELENFIRNGIFKFIENNQEKVYSLWEGDTIQGNDLYNWIENRYFHKLIYESFEKEQQKVEFSKFNVLVENYNYNQEKLMKKIKSSYKPHI